MKPFFASLTVILATALTIAAQTSPSGKPYVFTEASTLTLTGKLMDTPNPYHRVDTVVYKGFTASENRQVRMPAGMAVAFKTDSPVISVQSDYGFASYPVNTNGYAARGYDLYIRKDGEWLWAASNCHGQGNEGVNVVLAKDLDGTMKECLLYLPILSELHSVRIGTEEGSAIEAIENPFRHRVAIFGSSFTHGISISRAGMSYPDQFTRSTGIQMLSLGCSGNCKLQPYFADVLAAADVDAFVFDTFSNPKLEEIKTRLFPFIEKLQAAHPGKPLIFQSTIYRENRNYCTSASKFESDREHLVDSLMAIAVKKYPDVYYIHPNATAPDHETSVDGIHPGDYGYSLWANSIRKPILKILKKYGIK